MLMIQILIFFIYMSFLEWSLHRWPLHNINGPFKTHILDHHRLSAKDMIDSDYFSRFAGENELMGGIFLCIIHFPIFFITKIGYLTIICYMFTYFYIHRKSHLDKIWAKKWIPWHYVHHCVNAKKNFGIIHPLFDIIFGTYQKI